MNEATKRAHMEATETYAKLSYCKRRQVGCIIVKDNRIISIGYNGTPPGWDNICEDEKGETYPYVYHAEANAISKLARSHESGEGASLFVTTEPCFDCAKLIAQVGIKNVYHSQEYKSKNGVDFLEKCKVTVERVVL